MHLVTHTSRVENGWGAPLFNKLCEEASETVQLLVGNSLPIRDLDLFCSRIPKNVQIFANRGVNGIDGHIATACGLATARPEVKTVLVCGDLTALHDISALFRREHDPNSRHPIMAAVVSSINYCSRNPPLDFDVSSQRLNRPT